MGFWGKDFMGWLQIASYRLRGRKFVPGWWNCSICFKYCVYMMERTKRYAIYSVQYFCGMESDGQISQLYKIMHQSNRDTPRHFHFFFVPGGGNMTSVVIWGWGISHHMGGVGVICLKVMVKLAVVKTAPFFPMLWLAKKSFPKLWAVFKDTW